MNYKKYMDFTRISVALTRPGRPTSAASASCLTIGTHWNLLLLGLILLLSACRGSPEGEASAQPLLVFAAASLSEAFTEVEALFEAQNPGVDVVFNFAGSQQLAQQLAAGAPGDVFASANEQQMERVITSGQVAADEVQWFACNRLVVILPTTGSARLQSLTDLSQPGTSLVLAAAEVPAGAYTLEFLDRASTNPDFPSTFRDDVLKNAVSYEQNVRAVLTKVVLGEVDAGIVYGSDVAGEYETRVRTLEIPDPLNPTAAYPIAPLTTSENRALAQLFVEFILSTEAQQILSDYGFQCHS